MAVYTWAICSYDEVVEALTDSAVPDSERALIERIINSVTDYIERYCNRYIKRRSDLIVEYPNSYGDKSVVLKHPPVSVNAVYIDADREFGSDTVVDSSEYFVDENSGIVTLYFRKFPKCVGCVKVEYYGGFTNVPEDLKDVAIQMVVTSYRRYKTKQIGYASVSGKGMQGTITVIPNSYQREVLDLYRMRLC